MALIQCPECEGKVSDKAKACIHCGCPLNADTKALEETTFAAEDDPEQEEKPRREGFTAPFSSQDESCHYDGEPQAAESLLSGSPKSGAAAREEAKTNGLAPTTSNISSRQKKAIGIGIVAILLLLITITLIGGFGQNRQGEPIDPYINLIGTSAEVGGNLAIDDDLYESLNQVELAGRIGSVSFKADQSTWMVTDTIWESSKQLSDEEFQTFVESLNDLFNSTAVFEERDGGSILYWFDQRNSYVAWCAQDYPSYNGTIVVWSYGKDIPDTAVKYTDKEAGKETSGNLDSDSSNSRATSSRTPSRGYSSSNDDSTLDEGIYTDGDAVYITDGKGNAYAQDSDGNSYIFNEDGSSLATDNKGNAVYDSDGDGSADLKSTDGGKTWESAD